MPALSITDLFTALSQADVLSGMLTIANTLGLNTTAWQVGQPGRTILTVISQKIADAMSIVAKMNQGGFLDWAAQTSVTPEGGPGWLDLLSVSGYNVTRIAATFATTSVTFTAVGAAGGTFAPGAIHVASGAFTYSNAASVTIPANGTVSVNVVADVAGANSSAGIGAINTLVTALVGVTVTNPTAAIGADAETNAALVVRCRSKLASISVSGPKGAYDYNAKTINGVNQVAVSSGSLTSPANPVTRSATVTNPGTSITSSTNATPIKITATAHGFATGTQVTIANHTVNTAANGTWTVIVIDANNFTLTGSVGNGVGGATGTATSSTGTTNVYVASAAGAYATPPNYTRQSNQSIGSSTNASPIQITLNAHGYANGDQIYISGHLVNTPANGSWTISGVTANTFLLNGSTGTGVGGATGTAYRYSDLDLIDKSIQANAVPWGSTVSTLSAAAANLALTNVQITVTGATSSLTDAAIQAAATTAITNLAAVTPIGGVGASTFLYFEAIRSAIFNANPNTVNVSLLVNGGTSDIAIPPNGVPTVSPAPVYLAVVRT